MSARRVLIIHPLEETRARLKATLGANDYVEAATQREAAAALCPPPSLVIAHHQDFKRLIKELDRKAPGAIRVVLSPSGDPEALEELEGLAAAGYDFLTVEADATWKLKTLVRRRASPRHPTADPVDAVVITRGTTLEARCVDVSNEGVGLLLRERGDLAALMPGEPILVDELRRGGRLLMEKIHCRVQPVRRVEGTAALLVGAVFDITHRRVPHAPARITTPLRIQALLRTALGAQATFSIGTGDGSLAQPFGRGFLAGGRLHLADPTPGHELHWEPGQAVTVSFEINGRQLYGHAGVVTASRSELVVGVPPMLLQVHRRASLRVPTANLRAQVTLVSPLSGQTVTRPLLDVSAIGASFSCDPGIDVFPPGLRLDDVVVELEGRRLQFSAVVACSGGGPGEDHTERRCGLQFTSIAAHSRQLLLDLLVHHQVAGAQCGSQTSFPKIWDFFRDEGAAWRDHSGPDGHQAAERAHQLLGDGAHGLSKTFVILHGGELDGHTSGLRIYSRTWLSQHLLVRSGFHRAAALSQQLMCLSFDYGEALPDIEYVRGLWRVSNRWAERIYGAGSMRLLRPGLAYRVRYEPMRLSLDHLPPAGPLKVKEARPDDESAFLAFVGATEDPVKLLSDDLVPGELHLESLGQRYAAQGLSRGRSLAVVEDEHGAPLGWGLLETMSEGLFWAEMYTSFRIYLREPHGPSATAARTALAVHAAQACARLGRKEVECHAGPADVADLEALGFVSLGPVYEFGAHRSVVRELTSQMIAVFARIRRHEKEAVTQAEHPEAERHAG